MEFPLRLALTVAASGWKIGVMATLLAFWAPSGMEIIVLLVVGLVLFGGNLPDVGRSVGKGLIEFRRGLKDLKSSAGFDEVSKVKDEMMNMARDVDPRRMMDVDEEHLPDDPYKDVYQEGEFNEVETSKPALDAPEDSGGDGEIVAEESNDHSPAERDGEPASMDDEPDGHGEPTDSASDTDSAGGTDSAGASEDAEEESRLEGSHREPHEEEDPPTFGYDRHG